MNLALVIDRSGSMKGDRIANAMNAAVSAIERLRDGDSVTVTATVPAVPSWPVHGWTKRAAACQRRCNRCGA